MMATITQSAKSWQEAEDRYNAAIAENLRRGWRIESESPLATTFVRGHRVNHVLHLILSVVTLGLWIPVWLFVSVFGGEDHFTVSRPDVISRAGDDL
jgi:hypothetical protein